MYSNHCIDLFIKILVLPVVYVIQFSSDVLQMLVQELQDLFTLAEAILIMMWQKNFRSLLQKRIQQPMQVLNISDFVFLTDVWMSG